MNDTTTNPTAHAIQNQLQRLDWMIPDAKKRVAKAAEQMLWRAQRAVEDATAMMNDTTTNPTASAIQIQLQRLDWMIPDAKKRVAKAAEQMLWRAQRAVEDATAMMSDEPCSLSWTDFADGDLREAKEAKAELNKLYEQQKLLQYLLKNQ